MPLPEQQHQLHDLLEREAARGFALSVAANAVRHHHPVAVLGEAFLNLLLRQTRHQHIVMPAVLGDRRDDLGHVDRRQRSCVAGLVTGRERSEQSTAPTITVNFHDQAGPELYDLDQGSNIFCCED
jgi:hypothetical protein